MTSHGTAGYDAFDDPYCYPGTTVLRNRLDIHDPSELEAFEVEISTLRADEPLPEGNFDPAHYCRIHHHLFQDVYDWAGEYRTVRTSKGGNLFCYPENIAVQMDDLYTRLRGGGAFANLSREAFLDHLTSFLAETERHPPVPRRQWPQPALLHQPARRNFRPSHQHRTAQQRVIPPRHHRKLLPQSAAAT